MPELLVLVVLLAPAPFGPPKAPPCVPEGAFIMTWRGIDAPTYFRERGNYVCHWQGKDWYGVWRCEDGVLTVIEWPSDTIGRSSERITWSVTLASPTTGELTGGSSWKLRPKKGRVD